MDARPARFEQSAVALVLLAGFVFQIELVIPTITVLLALSGALGPRRAPLPRLYTAAARNWLEPPDSLADSQTLRLTVIVQTGVLLVATALVFLGVGGLAWFVALLVAAAATFDAVTGSWIEARLYWQLARRSRP
jgi:Domain of unknown function (DUF4395)